MFVRLILAAAIAAALITAPIPEMWTHVPDVALAMAAVQPAITMPVFVRFRDLQRRGIVLNWPQLGRLIATEGFPPGRLLGKNTRAWTQEEVIEWLASRPVDKEITDEIADNDKVVPSARKLKQRRG